MVAIQRDKEMEPGSMYWNKGVRNKGWRSPGPASPRH